MKRSTYVLLAAATAVTGSTLLPYLLHASRPVPGQVYSGLEYNLRDQASYLMWINQVRYGSDTVANLYSVDSDGRFPPHPLWWVIGRLGRLTGTSTVTLYHAARLLIAWTYLILLFALARRLYAEPSTAWVAWVCCALGGGLAWLHYLLKFRVGYEPGIVSADYWVPEMWSYTSVMLYPHFAAGLALTTACVALNARAWGDGNLFLSGAAGVCLGLLVLVHPYTAVTLSAAITLHPIACRLLSVPWAPAARASAVAMGASAPFIAWQAWQVLSHEAMRDWAASNVMESLHPLAILMGFGFIGILALVQVSSMLAPFLNCSRHRKSGVGRQGCVLTLSTKCDPILIAFLISWVAASLVLIYSGVSFERRCVEALHIPLCLLAAFPIVAIAGRASRVRTRRWWALAVIIAACCLSSAFQLARLIGSSTGYVNAELFRAEEAIYRALGPSARVFTTYDDGTWIASVGRVRVWVGHGELTVDKGLKRKTAESLYSPDLSTKERLALFQSSGCNVLLASGDAVTLFEQDKNWVDLYRGSTVAVLVPK